jgi:fengycin family lipopeptide synthetase E
MAKNQLPISWIENSVFEHFKISVEQYPDKIAISDNTVNLSFQEVYNQVLSIVNQISSISDKNEPILILLENNPFFICAMLACLASGRGYIPLDTSFSVERNKQIIIQSESKTILTNPIWKNQYNIDETFDFIDLNIVSEFNNKVRFFSKASDLAYVLFTSGSTGKPKGVYQNQKNLLHDVMQYINAIDLCAEDNVTLLYSPSVNGAIRDIYGSLLVGATLYINNLSVNGLSSIPTFLKKNNITIYHSIPGIFRTGIVASAITLFEKIRLIYLAGDKILSDDIRIYKSYFTDICIVYVGIGSTENATIYRQWFIDKKTKIQDGVIPVGYAVEDRNMKLIDEEGNEVENGVLGEIQVRSQYCALGYWKDTFLTTQYFVFHEDGSRTVKTGDWGMINEKGLLEFKGRRDGQLKVNGFRVEIAEIELNLRKIEQVEDVAVTIHEFQSENKIIAFVKLIETKSLDNVKSSMEHLMPKHMLPYTYIVLDEIPCLGNFKVDYKSLKKIVLEYFGSSLKLKNDVINSENDVVRKLVLSKWLKYNSLDSYTDNLSWKSCGGSSIDLLNFIVSIEHELTISIPNHIVNDGLTPKLIEYQIHLLISNKTNQDINTKTHIYAFLPMVGIIDETKTFLSELNQTYRVTIIDYPIISSFESDAISVSKIIESIDISIFKNDDKKVFLGFCGGDKIAYSILNLLSKDELHNTGFFILDSIFSSNKPFPIRVWIYFKENSIIQTFKRIKKSVISRTNNLFENKNIYQKTQIKVRSEVFLNKKPLEVKSYLLISNSSNFRKEDLGWGRYLTNLTSEKLAMNHSEMFRDKKCQEIIKSKLVDFIEKG